MGYYDAIRDGIRIEKNGYGNNLYFPLCSQCGKETKRTNYIHGLNYLCSDCKLENKLADKEKQVERNKGKKEKQFENAIKRIEKQTNLKPYRSAIDKVKDKLHTSGYFDSTEEIMVAIELLKNKIGFIHQKKLRRYYLDFVIPSIKVVLEVDGSPFHTEETKKREKIRDDIILLNYGVDWEVIRISDKMINQNITKLVPALDTIRQKRKNIKSQYNGTLPDWYSDRW